MFTVKGSVIKHEKIRYGAEKEKDFGVTKVLDIEGGQVIEVTDFDYQLAALPVGKEVEIPLQLTKKGVGVDKEQWADMRPDAKKLAAAV